MRNNRTMRMSRSARRSRQPASKSGLTAFELVSAALAFGLLFMYFVLPHLLGVKRSTKTRPPREYDRHYTTTAKARDRAEPSTSQGEELNVEAEAEGVDDRSLTSSDVELMQNGRALLLHIRTFNKSLRALEPLSGETPQE